MQGTVISLDIGTTHLKAALFNGSGALLRLEKEPTPSVPGEGGAVYDPAAFRAIVLGQLERLIEASPSVPAGICVTGMAEAGLILDKKTGEPKSELLPWFHPGPLPLADELSAEEERKLRAIMDDQRSRRFDPKSIPALLAPVILFAGIFGGVFTPTEAGAILVAYSLVVGVFFYRGLNSKNLFSVTLSSAKTSAAIVILIAFSAVAGRSPSRSAISAEAAETCSVRRSMTASLRSWNTAG